MGGAQAAAGDEEIAQVPGLKAAERDVVGLPVFQVLVGRAGASLLPELDRPARSGHRVLELPPGQDVLAGEPIAPDHAAALTDADLGRGVRDERARERRERPQELRDGPGALAAFLLGQREEVAAGRELLRDAAEGELADDFAGLR